jgi:hypothetical protein
MAVNDLPSDPNPTLRAELTAALDVLVNPKGQIHGLIDMEAIASLSTASRTQIATVLTGRQRRRDLIQAVLTALDAVVAAIQNLEADGYPALDPFPVLPTVLSEIQEEIAALEAAEAQFLAAGQETGQFNPLP